VHLLVFDSGIGGLGVVGEIRALRPDARITYFMDNGFFPYGAKPDEVLLPHLVKLIGQAIAAHRPDVVVVACNTASTIALSALRAAYDLPIVGCVPPIKPAAAASRTGHIGVLATAATVRRPYLNELIARFAPGCTVYSLGTPTLAALAEEKFRGSAVDVTAAIAPLFAQPGAAAIDAVALGCTHYTFLRDEFAALYPNIAWCDPALPVARRAVEVGAGFPESDGPGTACFTAPPADEAVVTARLRAMGFVNIKVREALLL